MMGRLSNFESYDTYNLPIGMMGIEWEYHSFPRLMTSGEFSELDRGSPQKPEN